MVGSLFCITGIFPYALLYIIMNCNFVNSCLDLILPQTKAINDLLMQTLDWTKSTIGDHNLYRFHFIIL